MTVTPESVSPDAGRDTADVAVEVKNCRGEAVEGVRVESDGSERRGTVTAATTGADGIAHLTYKLDVSRVRTAGEDTFRVVAVGRGDKKAYAPVAIEIEGIMLDAVASKPRVSPREATEITATLYSVDRDSARNPLAGRTLKIDETAMASSGARAIPMGATDSNGNPITDANGQVRLKFIAGTKEQVVKLRILYDDDYEAFVWIEVKKDEYRVTITWDEQGTGVYHYTQGTHTDEQVESEYSFGFDSRTTWNKYSGEEATTTSLRYAEQGISDYTGLIPTESEYHPTVFGNEVTRWTMQGQGAIKNAPSINLVVDERLGTLYVALNAVPVTTTGHYDISSDLTLARSTATMHYEVTDDWSLPISSVSSGPAPIKFQITRYLSHYTLTDYFNDPNVNGLLKKTGGDTFTRRWHYDDAVSYVWEPFDELDWLNMVIEVEGEFSRDATIKAVKL